ncbi:MAG: deoxyribose-phosphate aldolase [Oscillospiraceae bacterium]
MNVSDILSKVDHTFLSPEATWDNIKTLCDEAIEYKTASICINSCFVKAASDYLNGKMVICSVVGFPLGAMSTPAKAFEAKQAVNDGAKEIDMVINIGKLKEKDYEYVLNDIVAVKKAIGKNILKVIIETCLLSDDEKKKMCEIVAVSGADFIKTSTGFSTSGATFDDIKLFYDCIGGKIKIKAAGGIKTIDDMTKFIELGADRLGTSRAIKIINNR